MHIDKNRKKKTKHQDLEFQCRNWEEELSKIELVSTSEGNGISFERDNTVIK